MRRGDFVERKFTCALCGERFEALTGPNAPPRVVCMHCGLRHSPEKLRALLEERAGSRGRNE